MKSLHLALSLAAAGGIAGLAAVTAARPAQAQVAQKPSPREPDKYTITAGNTEITAPELEFDDDKYLYIFSGGVELLTTDSRILSDEMTVQMTAKKELVWAKCNGDVSILKKNADGTTVEAWCDRMEHYEKQKLTHLFDHVLVHQGSPSLAKPAIITGAKVDMDDNKKTNVVYRTPTDPAKVHLEPKGTETNPNPEPADLTGDRIDMNTATQEYVATGKPKLVRPSSRLLAQRIRFQVDEKTKELQVAYGDDDVIYDEKSPKGSLLHATGDRGVFTKETNEIIMEGRVYATTKEPDAEQPNVYEGDLFTYNSKTGQGRLKRLGPNRSRVLFPQGTTVPGAEGDKKKPKTDKPDSTPDK